LSKPVFEPDLSELRVVFGKQCSLLYWEGQLSGNRQAGDRVSVTKRKGILKTYPDADA
jgi:hypothetical protein